MSAAPQSRPFEVESGGVRLAGEARGEGPPLVLLHGLTATRRYVVHGSRLLARSGFELIGYDARGHGDSPPAPNSGDYAYPEQVADLAAVLDRFGGGPAVLAGHSMGAHAAAAFALERPERVAALGLVTPASDGRPPAQEDLDEWDALADGLRRSGVDGFLAAYQPSVEGRWREAIIRFTRQRLERHRDLRALADALQVVPRSVPFDGIDALEAINAPALVVGSRDEADPGHPRAVARAYADRLPNAELAEDRPGETPLAWRGAELSWRIARFLRDVGVQDSAA